MYCGNNDKVDIVDSVPCNDVILSYVLYIIVIGCHEYAIVSIYEGSEHLD